MRLVLKISFLMLLLACQEEVNLDLGNVEKTPLIEATWTDDASMNAVTVAYSRDYYDTLPNEVATHAEVSIEDLQTGEIVVFLFDEDLGQYLAENQEAATIGHEYQLHVSLDGKDYLSKGTTLEAPVLDSITYEFKEERFFASEGYYLTLYGKIPFNENNFYRLILSKNDTVLNRRSDYFLFDDTFGSSILNNGFELTAFSFDKEDEVRLQMLRLNEGAYDYLNQVVSLLFSDGGLFSPPPENPQSNISVMQGEGRVLGYFMTAPVLTRTVVIQEED
ncbi:DUF4249 family protein [Cyclobacterium plantarum]|uniref:DUF4249 domain-containing protein n=1 Tax=Cyclobacterium plantarum TaxID=2716263 RepID=A0ABX0H8P2_9BACT|nr:DUF4249 family protein [Cyclobacterium plantarum]NHE57987.1 DUF4249 domain-containing protein [Cyclobacterium plantarum]